jgi:hypothetical protein
MECVIVYLRIDNKIGYLFFYGGGILRLNQCLTMEVSYDGGILRWRQRRQAQLDFTQRRHIILHNQRQIVA